MSRSEDPTTQILYLLHLDRNRHTSRPTEFPRKWGLVKDETSSVVFGRPVVQGCRGLSSPGGRVVPRPTPPDLTPSPVRRGVHRSPNPKIFSRQVSVRKTEERREATQNHLSTTVLQGDSLEGHNKKGSEPKGRKGPGSPGGETTSVRESSINPVPKLPEDSSPQSVVDLEQTDPWVRRVPVTSPVPPPVPEVGASFRSRSRKTRPQGPQRTYLTQHPLWRL